MLLNCVKILYDKIFLLFAICFINSKWFLQILYQLTRCMSGKKFVRIISPTPNLDQADVQLFLFTWQHKNKKKQLIS